MVTNTAGTTARELAFQAVHYLRKTLTVDDTTATFVGTIPSGAIVIPDSSGFLPTTDFDGSSPTIDVGVDGETDAWMDGGDIDTVGSFVPLDQNDAGFLVTADTDVYALVGGGGSHTTGSGELVIMFIPDNDG
jgi:hypothetical protein